MNDEIHDRRKENYRKAITSQDICSYREQANLSLRKITVENYIMSRRMINFKPSYEINPNLLDIDIYEPIDEHDYIKMINMINSNNINYIKYGIHLLKNFISSLDNKEEIFPLLDCRIFDIYYKILSNTTDITVQYETIWSIINFTCLINNNEITILTDYKYIELFLKLLDTPCVGIKEMTIWCISNIIGDMSENRRKITNSNIPNKIFEIANDCNNLALIVNISSFLRNFVTGTIDLNIETVLKIIEIFKNYIYIDNIDTISNCLWGLSFLSEYNIDQRIFIPILKRILSINYDKSNPDLEASLIIIGNLISIDDNFIADALIELDVIDFIETIINIYKDKRLKKKILWIASNFTSGSKKHINILIETDLMKKIVSLLDEPNYDVKKEALRVITTITLEKHFSHSINLINMGTFRSLINILSDISDKDLIESCLIILDNIFKSGMCMIKISNINPLVKKFEEMGGIEYLERLQNHYSEDIYKYSQSILNIYFENYYKL